ncbi:hypothetical protein WSM22_12050 [Cytophagales bacterium WSM2-2]|nr:hypothetical protein WSM22_12050 [Cytophagales bacterium WSM2-2]
MVFVFLHFKSDKAELPKEQVDKIMEGHFANIKKMAAVGKLLVAGPFDGGGGIFIFNSKSVSDVREWLKDDPGIKNNRWNVEVLPFRPRVGKPTLVKEPFEMTSYQFVTFTSYVAKFNVNDLPQLVKKHDEYLKEIMKSGNVIAEGIFGDYDGGILIMKGDLDPKVIENDPAVREGFLEIEIKKWYVAKGAFGEK